MTGGELVPARIDLRRGDLDRDWNALDGELRKWVDERIEDLRARAEERSLSGASDALQTAWARELSLRHLDPELFPGGLPHAALELVALGRERLTDLEVRLAADDAATGVLDIDAGADGLDHALAAQAIEERPEPDHSWYFQTAGHDGGV